MGAVVGFIEGFVVVFVALFFLNQPAFNIGIVQGSQLKDPILNSTPFLSSIVSDFNRAFTDIYELSHHYEENADKNSFNLETVNILLKYNIAEVDFVDHLVRNGKLDITGIDSVLNQYRED